MKKSLISAPRAPDLYVNGRNVHLKCTVVSWRFDSGHNKNTRCIYMYILKSLFYFLGTIFPVTYNAPLPPPTHFLSPPLCLADILFLYIIKKPRHYNLSVKLISKGQFKMFTFLPVINIFQMMNALSTRVHFPP